MKRLSSILTILLVLGIIFSNPIPVEADIAPPDSAPGANPQVDVPTRVRMASERVDMTVRSITGDEDPYIQAMSYEMYPAAVMEVVAVFNMINLSNQEETLTVRFPLANPAGDTNGWVESPIAFFKVSIKGQELPFTIVETDNPSGAFPDTIPWAAFEISFPPYQTVQIEVSYTTSIGMYGHVRTVGWFDYLLQTGAGWYGTIGHASIVAHFPYPVTEENTGHISRNGLISGNEIIWDLNNFEPTEQDNIRFYLTTPDIWQAVLDARATVRTHTTDWQAWHALAAAYNNLNELGPGNPSADSYFQKLADYAYQKALELNPSDPDLHAEYAQFVAEPHCANMYDDSANNFSAQDAYTVYYHLKQAKYLQGRYSRIVSDRTFEELGWCMLPEGTDFFNYFAGIQIIPLPTATRTPTIAPTPTQTVTPGPSPTPMPTRTVNPNLPDSEG